MNQRYNTVRGQDLIYHGKRVEEAANNLIIEDADIMKPKFFSIHSLDDLRDGEIYLVKGNFLDDWVFVRCQITNTVYYGKSPSVSIQFWPASLNRQISPNGIHLNEIRYIMNFIDPVKLIDQL